MDGHRAIRRAGEMSTGHNIPRICAGRRHCSQTHSGPEATRDCTSPQPGGLRPSPIKAPASILNAAALACRASMPIFRRNDPRFRAQIPGAHSVGSSCNASGAWTPSIVRTGHDQTVYLVLDDFGRARPLLPRDRPQRADLETVVSDLCPANSTIRFASSPSTPPSDGRKMHDKISPARSCVASILAVTSCHRRLGELWNSI